MTQQPQDEAVQQGEDEVTDYAISSTFTHKCNKCGDTLQVTEGVPEPHTCSA